VTGSGTRRQPREIKAWWLIVALVAVLAVDVAWAIASW
jgi:hypothetical protein